jgi:UDP-N-acetylglucosamine 2-epimerase (non-hydrolysing)
MKVTSVVGARPQFVKLKPMVDALARVDAEHAIVHTGQHYDFNMSDIFFSGLALPDPDINLAVGSGSQAEQTGEILIRIEAVIAEQRPDWLLVYGDTNSTIAATLAAVKIGIPVAHIEAGLRSHNRAMPEEINRVLTDHAADILFAPTVLAMENLSAEGLGSKSHLVGDVMADLVQSERKLRGSNRLPTIQIISGRYIVATIHRPSNTDNPERLKNIISALSGLDFQVVLVAHPRLQSASKNHGIVLNRGSLQVIDPLPYLAMIDLIGASSGVITDSGGLQKEAFLMGVPCTTIRSETEWPETLMGRMNVLNYSLTDLGEITERSVDLPIAAPFGDGHAAEKIVELLDGFQTRTST